MDTASTQQPEKIVHERLAVTRDPDRGRFEMRQDGRFIGFLGYTQEEVPAADGGEDDTLAVIPDSSYASVYQTTIDDVIARGLAKDPSQRPGSATELLAEVAGALGTGPAPAAPATATPSRARPARPRWCRRGWRPCRRASARCWS